MKKLDLILESKNTFKVWYSRQKMKIIKKREIMQFSNKALIKNRSRRRFLSILSVSTLSLVSIIFFRSDSKKFTEQEEFILVNGWVLKKKDLIDI